MADEHGGSLSLPGELGVEVQVERNDAISLEEIERSAPAKVSPALPDTSRALPSSAIRLSTTRVSV